MKRRDFSAMAASATTWVLGGSGMDVWAQGTKPVPGTNYQIVDPKAPVEAPKGKIEVVDFFWYSCPHCNAFEPALQAWIARLPQDVAFRRNPIAFNDSFAPQQRLFFSLEAMGLVDKLHAKVFAAIHVEHQNLAKSEAIAEWVGKQGVDKAKFMEHYNSFSVAAKTSRATQLQNAYKIEGVPSIGLAGRYMTDGNMAGNMERALEVVDALISEVRAGRA